MAKHLLEHDLERFQGIDPGNTEALWSALECLVDHLDDHLVVVDEIQLQGGDPCRLLVFTARDDQATPLYAMILSNGSVIVGRADRLDCKQVLPLDDFDPVWDVIISLVVTGELRPLGERLDLWIVVQRYPKPPAEAANTEHNKAIVAYHGLIWLDNPRDPPSLQPARDDGGAKHDDRLWQYQAADLLPCWLKEYSVTFVPCIDPLAVLRTTDRYDDGLVSPGDLIVCGKDDLCFARNNRVYLASQSRPSKELQLPEAIRSLALLGTVQGVIHGVAGCEDRSLVAFRETASGLEEVWREVQHDFPMALAALPVFVAEDSPNDWPDLLLALSDGRLQRLRYRGQASIRKVWEDCWKKLELTEASARITSAQENLNHSRARRQVTLIGAIESVLEATDVRPEQYLDWVNTISGLFRPATQREVLSAGLDYLLTALSRFALGQERARSLPDGMGDFLPALIYRIYVDQAQIRDKYQIDWVVKVLELKSSVAINDSNLQKLQELAERTAETIWHGESEGLTDFIEKSIAGLELWSNAYVPTDMIDFKNDKIDRGKLVGIAGLITHDSNDREVPWLVIARQNYLNVYQLNDGGKLIRKPDIPYWNLVNTIHSIIRLSDNDGDCLLIVDNPGNFYLLKMYQDGWKLIGISHHHPCNNLSWTLAGCCHHSEGYLIAIIFNKEHYSNLFLYQITIAGACLVNQELLDLPVVESADLALEKSVGYRLIVGSLDLIPERLYRLTIDGSIDAKEWLWNMENGALVVRFDTNENPRYAVAGDRRGFLYCVNLRDQLGLDSLRWIFRMDGAIRSIEVIDIIGLIYFVVGSESGQLCLLQSDDGNKVWEERLGAPIRHITKLGESGQHVMTALRGDQVVIFKQVSIDHRQAVLKEVEFNVDQFETITQNKDWNQHADAERVIAFRDMIQKKKNISVILENTQDYETRDFCMRYLADKIDNYLGKATAIISHLNFTDCATLLSYLPDNFTQWNENLWDRLKELSGKSNMDLSARKEAEVAIVTFYNHAKKSNIDIKYLLNHQVPSQYLESPWVRLVFNQLLVTILCQQVKHNSTKTSNIFIPKLVSCILRLDSKLFDDLYKVFPYDSKEAIYCHALMNFLRGLYDKRTLISLKENLAQIIAISYTRDNDWIRALCSQLNLMYCVTVHEKSDSWSNWRDSCFHMLHIAETEVHNCDKPEGLAGEILNQLRLIYQLPIMLPNEETLDKRIFHLQKTRRHLITNVTPINEPRCNQWNDYAENLLKQIYKILDKIISHELDYLSQQMRPRLICQDFKLDANNRLFLQIKVEPEGFRALTDVNVQLTVEGKQGLSLPGELTRNLKYENFSIQSPARYINFKGYIHSDQKTVTVRSNLYDGEGYELHEDWFFQIPVNTSQMKDLLLLPQALPLTYQHFFKILVDSKHPVILAVIDSDLGRDILLEDWDTKHPDTRLDLDISLRDFGSGQLYSERELDSALIQQTIDTFLANNKAANRGQQMNDWPPAIMMAPVDEMIQRLLDVNTPTVLEVWWYFLRSRAESNAIPRLIVVVSSQHACYLRRLGLSSIVEVAAHRVIIEAKQDKAKKEFEKRYYDELIKLITTDAHLKDIPEKFDTYRDAERMGWDLRLIIRWLRWIKKTQDGRYTSPQQFLAQNDIITMLQEELKSLEAYDLILTLVGAESETLLDRRRVWPGHVAAQTIKSTTVKHQPKTIQDSGVVFTQGSLNRIGADRQPPTHLWVQGFGTERAEAAAPRSNLLEIARYRLQERGEAGFRRLSQLGFGAWHGHIFRTISPYRELINHYYNLFSTTLLEQRDDKVWAALLGEARSPVELINPVDFYGLPQNYLERLMPGAVKTDLKCLQELTQYWQVSDHEKIDHDPEDTLKKLFQFKIIRRLIPKQEDWDYPIVSMALPCFGVGYPETNYASDSTDILPECYVLWVNFNQTVSFKDIGEAIELTISRYRREYCKAHNKEGSSNTATLRVAVMGPGADRLEHDPDRRVAVWRLKDICSATWQGNLLEGLWRRLHVQLRLTAFSPFQTSGALPPGSANFKGREDELEFMKSHIKHSSILIVGGRRMGKTSLLNQIYYWAHAQNDLQPIFIDLQDVNTGNNFTDKLIDYCNNVLAFQVSSARHISETIIKLKNYFKKLPVFFLNEIDGLVENDMNFLLTLRGLNDSGDARFIMVGYSVIGQFGKLGDPRSPFFHFTEGNNFDGKAISLGPLSKTAAESLLALLEIEQLGLRWESPEQRTKAYKLLLERSYRIPWILQRFGQLLLEQMERERCDVLCFEGVERMLRDVGRVVWNYFNNIEYSSLGFSKDLPGKNSGFRLILFCLARNQYFIKHNRQKTAAINDPRLRDRSPLDTALGFTVDDVRTIVHDTINQLLVENEKMMFKKWLYAIDLPQALRLLSLTLALEPDPKQIDRYGFLLHILPIELFLQYHKNDPFLDNLILNEAARFTESLVLVK